MEKVLFIAVIITLLFCIMKFIEMRYIEKRIPPLKFFVRDVIMIFISSFVGAYVLTHMSHTMSDFYQVITGLTVVPDSNRAVEIFTDLPE